MSTNNKNTKNTKNTNNWTDERIDTLAALLTVTDEQLADRRRAESGLTANNDRVKSLIRLVFGDDSPSVENYITARGDELVAA